MLLAAAMLFPGTLTLAANARTDYDQHANFVNYKIYSWGTVRMLNPLNELRVKAAVDADEQTSESVVVACSNSFLSQESNEELQLAPYNQPVEDL